MLVNCSYSSLFTWISTNYTCWSKERYVKYYLFCL